MKLIIDMQEKQKYPNGLAAGENVTVRDSEGRILVRGTISGFRKSNKANQPIHNYPEGITHERKTGQERR